MAGAVIAAYASLPRFLQSFYEKKAQIRLA